MRDDRSLPVTALHRFNYATPATRKYNEAAKVGATPFERNLKPASPIKRTGVGSKSIRDRIKEDGKKKQAERDSLNANPSNPDFYKNYKGPKPAQGGTAPAGKSPAKRFCGGKSKPYKRK